MSPFKLKYRRAISILARLEDRQLITMRRSKTDARRWVYCLPQYTTFETNTTDKVDSTSSNIPPPSSFSSHVELVAETISGDELEDSQHLFNTHSTTIQHLPNVELKENAQTLDEQINTEPQKFIQHSTQEKGERGYVEQAQFDSVLQNTPKKESQSVADFSR